MSESSLIGKQILGYVVSETIDSGAFGTVYKVIKTNVSGQYVRALKHITIPTKKQYNSVLNSMGGDASKADNYFLQMLKNVVSEIQILNTLSEKDAAHIVRYYENDIQTIDSPKQYNIFILMEYLTPLDKFIEDSDFCVRDVVKLGLDVLSGLRLCHDNGVIHRDIKDENIFVSDNGEFKIGDFGVSKILKDSSKAESLKGTPNFLAPEVYLGKESYTKSVDLYSLGIVLYRLLNYSRNPFLPHFPEQYYSADENIAFEERMSGKIPDLPSLGGDLIGQVIIKSISDSSSRFQTADEFIDAFEKAAKNTSDDILNKSVKIKAEEKAVSNIASGKPEYKETIGEVVTDISLKEKDGKKDNEYSPPINSDLFISVGEKIKSEAKSDDYKVDVVDDRKSNFVPESTHGYNEPKAIDANIKKYVIYAIPFVIALVGVIAYFVVIPNIYGDIISFVKSLFYSPQKIIDSINDPSGIINYAKSLIGIKFFWWIWLAFLSISLFFVGKQLHTRKEPDFEKSILVKNEPYLITQEILDILKRVERRRKDRILDKLIYDVNCLEEQFSVETDFGYGSDVVKKCENDIANNLQFLLDAAKKVETGDINKNVDNLTDILMNIKMLMRRRRELKKK